MKKQIAALLGESENAVVVQAKFMGGWIALLWIIEVLHFLLPSLLDRLGLIPRVATELPSILTAPFLHFGFAHVAANTLPLLVLGWITLATGWRRFLIASFVIIAVGGAGVWLFGRSANHAGVSILIFGYFGYLLTFGILSRSIPWIIIAIIVGFFYGSAMWGGVLPGQRGVSWEGHLFGLIAGVLAAWLMRSKGRYTQIKSAT